MNKDNKKSGFGASLLGFLKGPAVQSVLSSLICIVAGILIGFVVMLIIALTNERMSIVDAFNGIFILIRGPFATGGYAMTNFGDMVFYAVPLILTGLSVAIAFKTGLFNIGAPGQYLMGTIGALLVALSIKTDGGFEGFLVWLLAIVVAMLLGMVWGAIPGFFKAVFGANEVIVCIMTNWIAANIASWLFSGMTSLINSGHGKSGYLITTAMTGNGTPKAGLDSIFSGSYIDLGIFIAIAVAVAIYIILNKTTFGYELKACGYNRNASKYAGMNEKRNIVLSMAIAGALAALAGALYYLNPGIEFKFSSAYSKLPDYGFNGIPAALLASNNPIGVIFSGLFLRFLGQGGDNLVSAGYNRYISDVIIALIIYFAGFSKFILDLMNMKKRKASMSVSADAESAKPVASEKSADDESKKSLASGKEGEEK